ncbi:LysR family transcriptional regulator [Rhodanobacter sp. Col0626]|uniref:LysR family transcriptional regulator n=1 Tax=Rhodanobacter sp. Col0626 TaxID=3415679 RepID=UPI003CE6E056
MRLRHIELFHAVLTTGSLTGAARLLSISQPAASKVLQHAELQLGFALFSRVRGRLQPTPEALLLRHRVEKIVQELHGLQRLTANIGRPEHYPLRVTCTPTLAHILVPTAATALRTDFPGATVELFTQHSMEMCESLMLHEADIGLTLQEAGRQGLRQDPLCHGHVMVIAPPGWWSAEELEHPLPIGALAGQPMIGITVQDALGRMLQSHLKQVTPMPQISVWVQTYQLARSLVAQGQGLALVDPFTAWRDGEGAVQMRPLKLELCVTLYAVYRQDSPLNPMQKRFLAHVRRLAQRMLSRD